MRNLLLSVTAFAILPPIHLMAQYVIPLEAFPEQNRLGISVRLGTAPESFTYLLDTGSVAFLSARGRADHPSWTGAYESISTETFSISYTGSLAYQGNVASTTLTFQTTGGPLAVPNVRMGAISPNEADEPFPGWYAAVNASPPTAPEPEGGPPLFFGTFGAGLNATANDNGNMVSVLSQIPVGPGFTRGFIIQSGGENALSGSLTVGLTPDLINSFPILIPMNAATGTYTIGSTTFNLYPQAQTTANYSISRGADAYSVTGNLILDTGGENTFLTTGSVVNPPDSLLNEAKTQIIDGAAFTVQVDATTNPVTSAPGQPLVWTTDPTGSVAFDNQIQVDSGNSVGSLNSGINLFYEYDVMFDTEHGVIGLRPIPEPLTTGLVLGGIFLVYTISGLRKRRMLRAGR